MKNVVVHLDFSFSTSMVTGFEKHTKFQNKCDLVIVLWISETFLSFFGSKRFDVAGAGACLKRYTDPSVFKAEPASSVTTTVEVHRQKKIRKVRVLNH